MMPPPTHACTHARSHYRCCCFRCHPLAELKGKLNGLAIRVPLLNGSITDCVFEVQRPTTVEEVNALLKVRACVYHTARDARHRVYHTARDTWHR